MLPTKYADPAAFDVLNRRHFAGIFQFAGQALQRLCRQMKIESLDDMVAITALARPGPMDTGAAERWVRRRTGKEAITYAHPLLEPLLKETLGLIIYQESVMSICREIGGMDWPEVNAVRRAIGKSKGSDEINKYGESFKRGAAANGVDQETADRIWSDILTFGRYGFNKSHAVAYSIVSYWCCWLKAHHPLEFAAATLDAEKEPLKQIALLRELADEGIEYTPVDPDHSSDRWTIAGRRLVGPLTQIKGIGPATMREILDARKAGRPIRETLRKKLLNAKTEIDTLFPVRDAVTRLHPDLTASGITTKPTPVRAAQCGMRGEIVVIGVANKIAPKDENEAVNVARRGGKRYTGPTKALNLFIRDDTDEIFAKVNRFDYERLGRQIVERGRAGAALYAIKGEVWSGFRGIGVTNVKFLGFLDE